MYTRQSGIEQHCIIQWHSVGKERDQTFFQNSNHSSQTILPSYLKINKENKFINVEKEDFTNPFNTSSYKIDNDLFMAKSISLDTTDLFLYGHSTTRESVHGKFSRGISIGKHYVSAAKVALFLNEHTPARVKFVNNLRIWLLSCHSGMICEYTYSEHLSEILKNSFGWKNKQFIGFSRVVTHHSLQKCRSVAAKTKLFAKLELRSLRHEKPHIITY